MKKLDSSTSKPVIHAPMYMDIAVGLTSIVVRTAANEEEDSWSWKKDTTFKDITENPVMTLLVLGNIHRLTCIPASKVLLYSPMKGTLVLAYSFPSILRQYQQSKTKAAGKEKREALLQKAASQPPSNIVVGANSGSGRGKNSIKIKKKELYSLLTELIDALVIEVATSIAKDEQKCDEGKSNQHEKSTLSEISTGEGLKIEWGDLGGADGITDGHLEDFCLGIKNQVHAM